MQFRHILARVFGRSMSTYRSTNRRGANRPKRRTRLDLECLEDRTVPTIIYQPVFGPETTSQDGSEHMQQPQVYLVFWGGYWVSDGSGQVQSVINAATQVVTSTFPLITDQYGADGSNMSIAGTVFDPSTPTNGSFDGGDINDVVQNQIDNGALPESDAFNGNDHSKIYVVITPPNFLSNDPKAIGFNQVKSDTDIRSDLSIDSDDIGECWVYGGNDPHDFVDLNEFSTTFSHEVAEIMSDFDGEGYEVNPPPGAPPGSGNQIGDYEGNGYAFRLSNGVDVQPVWSRADNAWAVDDGTAQNFYLDATGNWAGNQFSQFNGTYALTLQGDQNGPFQNDTVTIDQVYDGVQMGGVQVTQNGETVTFDKGQITSITVDMKDGNDTINVESAISGVPITINLGSGHDVVNISPSSGNLDNMKENVTVNSGASFQTLNVYDQNNFHDAAWTLNAGSVTRTNSSTIYYNGLFNSLNFNGGRGNDVFQVNGTQPAFPTTVNAGTNNSAQFLIEGTTGPFFANLGSGVESVVISPSARNLDNISGFVSVNGLHGNQTNTLVVNDQNDGNFANWQIEGGSVLRDAGTKSVLIFYKNMADLELRGGFGGSTFNVTPIGQNLDFLPNTFNITGGKFSDSLTLNDQGNKRFADWSITGSNVTRTSITVFPLQVVDSVNYSHIGNLTVNGGSGGNVFNLSPTAMNLDELPTDVTVNGGVSSNTAILDDQKNPNFSTWDVTGPVVDRSYVLLVLFQNHIIPLTVTENIHYSNLSNLVLNGGSGGSEFDLSPLVQNLDELPATVSVNGGGAANTLNVFDQGNSSPSSWNIGSTSLNRTWLDVINLGGGLIFVVPITSTINYSALTSLAVHGGGLIFSAGNSFTITGTPASTSVDSGFGNDQVNVQASANPLSINGDFSTDTVTLGSNAPSLGGTLSNIAGPVTVANSFGQTALIVDDSGDAANRTATVTSSSTTGLPPVAINYANLSSLTIDGGSGLNTYNVQSTAAGTSVILNSGSGSNDEVIAGSGGITSTLNAIQGALTVNSQTSLTALLINDSGATGQTYTVTAKTLSRSGAALITYDPVTSLTINAGGNDSLVVAGALPGTPVTFNGGGGTNTLVGPDSGSTYNVTAPNGGTVGNVTFNSVQNLVGGLSNDTFVFHTGGNLAGSINGGGGVNTLDYSSYVGNLFVDLPLGMATGSAGGISHIENVTGSQGNDLIVGDANANVLIGGTGRNIIIGGAGADTITGGGGNNLLVGGTTLWDTNVTALNALMAEWTNPTLSIGQRSQAIRKGIVAGGQTYALNKSTVFADSSPDNLMGGPGNNWFFVDIDDTINNGAGPGPNDVITHV